MKVTVRLVNLSIIFFSLITAHQFQWHTVNFLITSRNSARGHYYRSVQYDLDQPDLVFGAQLHDTGRLKHPAARDSTVSAALLNLPPNVKILPWPINQNEFIVRFHNMDDQNIASINLATYLDTNAAGFKMTETTVTGNQELASMLRTKIDWTYKKQNSARTPNQDYLQGILCF